ncbi:elongation factor P maturation arginine rhamnosyltransferase EarP [Thiofilum flexile]|uniref:elongation factor P maturation arginine rhamnosyltransferase EarP n=1 Tax=Thiofilum flexile TaxID=125627 RepID=UPI0003803604|nr:elongation factor P maturation arginine rhamnosyltransferase EarP [Thiofilum flexile]
MQWDIFCTVIDNYGDAGVCWRLARQLASEHQQTVRLIIDHFPTLEALTSQSITHNTLLDGVVIAQWSEQVTYTGAQVVIEAFACELPLNYQAGIKHSTRKPLWINLEYLTAEAWVEGCHNLSSRHPQLGIEKVFFFPGFTPNTGGLLREHNLFAQRDYAQSVGTLSTLFPTVRPQDYDLTLSLFAYPAAPVTALLKSLAQAKQSVLCLVPACRIVPQIESLLGQGNLVPFQRYSYGALTIQVLPFMSQAIYDQVLWHCDLNFVRGEDSWVRAQWAARPLIWQAYPQADNAHEDKLAAFMQRYGAQADPACWEAIERLGWSWNKADPDQVLDTQWLTYLPQWKTLAKQWCDHLSEQPDLATQLLRRAEQHNSA